jgi:hypothetical protein
LEAVYTLDWPGAGRVQAVRWQLECARTRVGKLKDCRVFGLISWSQHVMNERDVTGLHQHGPVTVQSQGWLLCLQGQAPHVEWRVLQRTAKNIVRSLEVAVQLQSSASRLRTVHKLWCLSIQASPSGYHRLPCCPSVVWYSGMSGVTSQFIIA